MRNFLISIVSAVKFCRRYTVCKLLQLLGYLVPRPPSGASPLDPTGDFHPLDLQAIVLEIKITGADTNNVLTRILIYCLTYLWTGGKIKIALRFFLNTALVIHFYSASFPSELP